MQRPRRHPPVYVMLPDMQRAVSPGNALGLATRAPAEQAAMATGHLRSPKVTPKGRTCNIAACTSDIQLRLIVLTSIVYMRTDWTYSFTGPLMLLTLIEFLLKILFQVIESYNIIIILFKW